MAALPQYSYDTLVTVTYTRGTGEFQTGGEEITEDLTRAAWLRQVPVPSRDAAVFIAEGSISNPTRWRTRYIEGVTWKVGDRFTWRGTLFRVLGVQSIGRTEVELYTED